MERRTFDPPEESREQSADCARVSAWLPGYWLGEASRDEQRAMREHVLACAACRAEYERTSLVSGALARGRRLERIEVERKRRARWLASLGSGGGSRSKGMWVRTLLVPALLIAFLARRAPEAAVTTVFAEHGAYRLGEDALATPDAPQRVKPGDLVIAEEGARVTLAAGECSLQFVGPGSLLAERPAARRYRLGHGRFDVRGAHVLSTPWAVVEVLEGRADVSLDAERGEVRVETGRARVIRAEGQLELSAGDSAILGPGL